MQRLGSTEQQGEALAAALLQSGPPHSLLCGRILRPTEAAHNRRLARCEDGSCRPIAATRVHLAFRYVPGFPPVSAPSPLPALQQPSQSA